MCQINEQSIGDGPVEGYRIYELHQNGLQDHNLRSICEGAIMPEPGKPTLAIRGPFHILRSLEDVKLFVKDMKLFLFTRKNLRLYKCSLQGDVKIGDWEGGITIAGEVVHPKTATGKVCTIIKEVPFNFMSAGDNKYD